METFTLSNSMRAKLERLVRSPSQEARAILRARIVLRRASGETLQSIASSLSCSVTTVKKWLSRFENDPAEDSLRDRPRSGRPPSIPSVVKAQLVAMACAEPDKNVAPFRLRWTVRSLSAAVQAITGHSVSRTEVQRLLSNRQIRPHKVQMWLHSPDPDFAAKAEAVCKLYLAPPPDVHVVCVDEKTGMQAIEHRFPRKPAGPAKAGRIEFEYIRHGTQSLIASFDVATGGVWGHCGESRDAEDLMAFMEELATEVYDTGEVIVIWDNLNIHSGRRWEEFNERHGGRFSFVHTPIHASWLNQIEIWFGILERRVLRHGSFESSEELRDAVLGFIDHWLESEAHPFHWVFRGTFCESTTPQPEKGDQAA